MVVQRTNYIALRSIYSWLLAVGNMLLSENLKP